MTRIEEPATNTADPARIEAFAAQTVDRLASAWTIAAIHVGDRLGLYPALTEGAGTADDIAARASTNPRLTREWLDGQVAAGIVELDATGRYTLPLEHAAVLAVDDSPAFLAGAGGVLAAVLQAEDQITKAFRGDGRLAWGDQAPCLFGAVDRFYRTGYAASLVDDWIPSLARAVRDLDDGGRVADVGCGRGTALVMMAEAFPSATFVGIDNHDASLTRASERIASSGLGSRVRLERATAATFGNGPFDLICFPRRPARHGRPVGGDPQRPGATRPHRIGDARRTRCQRGRGRQRRRCGGAALLPRIGVLVHTQRTRPRRHRARQPSPRSDVA